MDENQDRSSQNMAIGHFLGGIAAVIWNPSSNKYLLLRRAAARDFQAGAWECVTGRVDQGESFEQALHREVWEEIGVRIQVEFLIATTHFYRGEPILENELLGVVFGCTIVGQAEARFGLEHSEQRWASAEEIDALLPEGHWLRQATHRAEQLRALLPEELRNIYRRDGFAV